VSGNVIGTTVRPQSLAQPRPGDSGARNVIQHHERISTWRWNSDSQCAREGTKVLAMEFMSMLQDGLDAHKPSLFGRYRCSHAESFADQLQNFFQNSSSPP
jgi:hypothetical protein